MTHFDDIWKGNVFWYNLFPFQRITSQRIGVNNTVHIIWHWTKHVLFWGLSALLEVCHFIYGTLCRTKLSILHFFIKLVSKIYSILLKLLIYSPLSLFQSWMERSFWPSTLGTYYNACNWIITENHNWNHLNWFRMFSNTLQNPQYRHYR